jgi:glucosyl-dolichyl phosphate glucuronosyltransferase
MNPQISAIVCTHNRSRYLRKALHSLARQTLPQQAFEILVIDNCSTDDTKRIVHAEFRHLTSLRYIYEPILGLSQARNTGWRAASSPYLAFLDDDAVADPGWLEAALSVFANVAKPIGIVGGPVHPIWECPRPDWLAPSLLSYFTILEPQQPTGFIDDDHLIAGANMILARDAVERVGGFLTTLGRKGTSLLSTEEVALRQRLTEAGYLSYYCEELSVGHHIPAERLNQSWLLDRVYWGGVSDATWWRLSRQSSQISAIIRSLREFAELAFHQAYLAILRGTGAKQQSIFLRRCRAQRQLGKLRGLFSRTAV